MLKSDLLPRPSPDSKPLVCAVSYLNTTPLVWGLLHSPLSQNVNLQFELPSVCADRVRNATATLGILPVVEIQRQNLQYLHTTGIACRGAVRSILLISKVPFSRIRTLAADRGSRTSAVLSRIILAECYGSQPNILTLPAGLDTMLAQADAALIIGDPALLLDPIALRLQYEVLDLGEEWLRLTNHPMIFALWAGRPENMTPDLEDLFHTSCRYGLARIGEIVDAECPPRGIPLDLGATYLTRHISFELTPHDFAGLSIYLRYAREFDTLNSIPNSQNITV